MAHALCPNGHDMWNGDGQPVVWAFRTGFFCDFMKEHPDCIFGEKSEYVDVYSCVFDVPGENLDCWYCDECNGVVVFVDIERYDFKRMETLPEIEPEAFDGWEDFIALRDSEFEVFQEFSGGKSPVEAIEQYDFTYRYKVSPDKKTFYAFDEAGKAAFGYYRSNYTEFSPNLEERSVTGVQSSPRRPYEWAKGKMDIHVRPSRYACLRDGRIIIIDSVIEEGKRYRGRDMNREDLPVVEVEHSEIYCVMDEI